MYKKKKCVFNREMSNFTSRGKYKTNDCSNKRNNSKLDG